MELDHSYLKSESQDCSFQVHQARRSCGKLGQICHHVRIDMRFLIGIYLLDDTDTSTSVSSPQALFLQQLQGAEIYSLHHTGSFQSL